MYPSGRRYGTYCATKLSMMTSRGAGPLREAPWLRGVALVVAVLALATGFCLFDRDHDAGTSDHAAPPDLCFSMLVAAVVVLSLVGLAPTGRATDVLFTPPYAVALHIPDPPPKLARPVRP